MVSTVTGSVSTSRIGRTTVFRRPITAAAPGLLLGGTQAIHRGLVIEHGHTGLGLGPQGPQRLPARGLGL